MSAEWYYETEGQQQHGPITAQQLKQLAVNGFLLPTHLVWKEGVPRKVPASAVKGLFTDLKKPAGGAPTRAPAKPATKAKQEEVVDLEPIDDVVELLPVEEVVELQPVGPPVPAPAAPPLLPAFPPPIPPPAAPTVLAEVPVTYRGGHPKLEDEAQEGTLVVETAALAFATQQRQEFRIPFELIENVLEPAKGDFPEAMKSSARNMKMAATAGKLVSGLAGGMLGDWGGKLVKNAGKSAADAVHESNQLGKVPRNRLTVIARTNKGTRYKIYLDTRGPSREDMQEEAVALYKRIAKARGVAVADVEAPPAEVEAAPAPAPRRSGGGGSGSAPAGTGKFRVMRAGKVQGPFTLGEIRRLLEGDKLDEDDLIGVEIWVPVSSLEGLFAGGGGKSSASGSAKKTTSKGREETGADLEELGEPEVLDDLPLAPADDPDAPLPVDPDLLNFGSGGSD